MRSESQSRRRTRTTLVAALLLLLATIATSLRVTSCLGDCCGATNVSCCGEGSACCGCCDSDADTDTGGATGEACAGGHAADDVPADPAQPAHRGTCRVGCCVTLDVDLGLGPVPQGIASGDGGGVAATPIGPTLSFAGAEPLTRGRPFDRGPPRIDERVLLRSTIELLI